MQDASQPTRIDVRQSAKCGSSTIGSASACHAEGCEFESRLPLTTNPRTDHLVIRVSYSQMLASYYSVVDTKRSPRLVNRVSYP